MKLSREAGDLTRGRDDPGREGRCGEREREGRGEGEGAARREAAHRAGLGAGVAAGGGVPWAGLELGLRPPRCPLPGRGAEPGRGGEGRLLSEGFGARPGLPQGLVGGARR